MLRCLVVVLFFHQKLLDSVVEIFRLPHPRNFSAPFLQKFSTQCSYSSVVAMLRLTLVFAAGYNDLFDDEAELSQHLLHQLFKQLLIRM